MEWHDIRDPSDPELDRLAERYHLHPLHIEDCRHRDQRAKVEEGAGYMFTVLKPVRLDDGEMEAADLDLFLGRDFVITVQDAECPEVRSRLDALHRVSANGLRADQLFYRILDSVVDSYLPTLDWFSDQIDRIEDLVLEKPSPRTLEWIFSTKRGLIQLRRVLSNTRDVSGHLERIETDLIPRELSPFLRDVYDHLARNLDLVEMQRDLLTGAMDIYLSSVANRTNQVVKVLTILGTIALPSLVISSIYGMNIKDMPWLAHPHGMWIVTGLMAASTGVLLVILKYYDWL